MHNSPNTLATREPVHPVMSEVVRTCLDDIDEIATTYLTQVRTVAGYSQSMLAADDLRNTAVASMELLLRLIGQLPLTERLLVLSEELGHRRARQGLPLEALLQAVRLDFRILWSAMLIRVSLDDLPEFTRGAIAVWEAVEFHTIRVHAGYLNELASLAQEREQQKTLLLSRLLLSDGKDTPLLNQAARALGVDVGGIFLVAVAGAEGHHALRTAAARNQSQKYLHEHEGALLLLIEYASRAAATIPSWLHTVPCGVAPAVEGLAEVPRMARIADDLVMASAGKLGMTTVQSGWGRVSANKLGEFGAVLADSVLGQLANISAHERERLLATITVLFESGSVSATVAELYCHRNTVLNRLSRFKSLTGLDPGRPGDAAIIQAALHCNAVR
ncbi:MULTISPECIES: CdaR family transcriptional regulator [unclassified Cryobacterium]|uniref:PucR family transcriptional regulator n=1 Tax=unclassified Cryobacterium TaxID=2649013 RepID=UPI00106A9795|nr:MULTISPECIES: helix-turn-helix domain-containing protein [unclassified Cryobacterium]TFD07640.1 PucR family transcriptional regulator [Cryobacterium sp. TMT1-66-1]TFD08071.1 PucR family transcriptional regulator [Cryobacterium sp. TMT1-2-2]